MRNAFHVFVVASSDPCHEQSAAGSLEVTGAVRIASVGLSARTHGIVRLCRGHETAQERTGAQGHRGTGAHGDHEAPSDRCVGKSAKCDVQVARARGHVAQTS